MPYIKSVKRRGTNSPPPRGAGITEVYSSADAMLGFDELDPRLRRIVHQAPLSLTARDVLRASHEHGVDATERYLLNFLADMFPGWVPIEDDPRYNRASKPMHSRRNRR
jgi:hypothetical protein